MESKHIYVCDHSIDGILTAVYIAWSSGYGHANVKLEEKSEQGNCYDMELFSDYIPVETDYALALKVAQSIKKKISYEVYEMVCRVALSDYMGKADLIYRFLILGFRTGAGIVEQLSNETVHTVFRVNKNVNNEMHHLLGFIRFSQKDNGLLTSVIHPKNNVLSLIAPHFADRLPKESFVIYDENRKLAVLHLPGKYWILTKLPEAMELNRGENSFEEDEYSDLWKIFFKSISIKDRENKKLQRNNMPLRFRSDMTEFQ